MPYSQKLDAAIGGETGLSEQDYAVILERTGPALDWLRERREVGDLPLLALPDREDDLEELEPAASRLRIGFDDIVILGAGGSSLGGQTLNALVNLGFGPSRKDRAKSIPELHFVDNVDPDTFAMMVDTLDLSNTGFLVISKSGGTAETVMQFACVLGALEKATGERRAARHMLCVTQPGDNPMRRVAEAEEIPLLDHDPGVGGRFSVLSVVGMLPAMIAGIDVHAIRKGASRVLTETLGATGPEDSPPARGAALNLAYALKSGIRTSVMFAYSDRLRPFVQWHRQLWSESLGKGGNGTLPAPAIGTIDQHSQLQLYLDGPRDKLFTLLLPNRPGAGARVSDYHAEHLGLPWLRGRTLGDLLTVSGQATADTLEACGRPVRRIEFAKLDAGVMGELLMHFMLEAIIAARVIGVEPFDQPAVEDGKARARAYMDELAGG